MEKIDLHMHSNFSDDADLPVCELIERCKTHNVTTLAITDHNSADSSFLFTCQSELRYSL